MRLEAFHIRFDRGMLEDVVHHKGREFLHPDESHRFVERHKEPVKAPAFKERFGSSKASSGAFHVVLSR